MRIGYRKNSVKVALLYPSTYPVAMSSASFHMLYFWLQDAGFYVERFTADRGPRGVEDGTPLTHFDYVLATIHYELDYVNLVKILLDAGIEPKAAARERPKIVVGGPPVVANPEPLAEIADLIAIGELEALWGKILDYLSGAEPDGDGLYYPARGNPTVRAYARTLGFTDWRRLPEPEAAFSISVEAARGCSFSCLFCMESYITKPYRPRPSSEVVADLKKLYEKYRIRPSLIALTLNAHPQFLDILRAGVPMSIPSLRAELLDEEALQLIAAAGQRTVTVAPETSERLRVALGKDIPDEAFVRLAKAARKLGLRLKAYLMVGLPCEKERDIEEIRALLKRMKEEAEVSLSVNPFVPKPQTPLQYHPMAGIRELEGKIGLVRRGHAATHYDVKTAAIQAAIALGGRDVADHIINAVREGGASYLRRLLRKGVFDYVFRPRKEPLPWSHIRSSEPPEMLWGRYEKFIAEACT